MVEPRKSECLFDFADVMPMCLALAVRAANLCLEANHLRVDFTPFIRERTTKAVQISHGMTSAVVAKVLRARGR
jgi:hypothetical protein